MTSLVRPAGPRHQVPAIRAQIPLAELRDLAADPGEAPDGDREVDEVPVAPEGRAVAAASLDRAVGCGTRTSPGRQTR